RQGVRLFADDRELHRSGGAGVVGELQCHVSGIATHFVITAPGPLERRSNGRARRRPLDLRLARAMKRERRPVSALSKGSGEYTGALQGALDSDRTVRGASEDRRDGEVRPGSLGADLRKGSAFHIERWEND